MSNDDVKTEPAPADAKEQIAAAMRSGRAKSKFRTTEEVVAEGIKAGEKEPKAQAAGEEEKSLVLENPLPEKIEITVDDDTLEVVETTEPGKKEEVVEEKSAELPAGEPVKTAAAKIKIGDKGFESEAEAITYAQELERQREIDEAFRQGIEAQQQATPSNFIPVAPPAAPEPETIPDIYYTNPAAYLKQREAEILAKASQNIMAQFEAQKRHDDTMNKFWAEHPDLARSESTRNITGQILNQNWEALKNINKEKALKIVAEKTRAMLKDLGVTTLPTKVIPSSTKPAVSSGTSGTVSRPKQEEKALNWTQQMKNMKNKKAEARRSR